MKLQGPTALKIDLSKNKYIKLQNLGHGSSSYVSLIYHIELEQLFAIKTFVSSESEKFFSRENKNYKLLRHPSIPLFYGETEFNGHNKSIIMEYIRGSNLLNINSLSFEIEDKINIIFQMMLLIEFFRVSKFVYRDLKPNNFIIDQNKRLILVDFDRMINKDEKKVTNESTMNFSNSFQAPEILSGSIQKYTHKVDIFSLGLLIYFCFFGKKPEFIKNEESNQDFYSFDEFQSEFAQTLILKNDQKSNK